MDLWYDRDVTLQGFGPASMQRPRSGPVQGRRAVAARGHRQVIHHSEPVTPARSGDGPEGRLLGFRGAESPVAAVADEDGARRPARLGSKEHRVGRKPRGLDPADGDDRMPDEAVAVVHVEDEDHVLPSGAEQVSRDPCSRCRVVYPSGQVQPCFRHGVRVGRRSTGAPGERSEKGVE